LAKFGIAYRIASPYHSQTSGQLSWVRESSKLFYKRQWISLDLIGLKGLLMHYGITELLLRILSVVRTFHYRWRRNGEDEGASFLVQKMLFECVLLLLVLA
jgi:hypothetical protein